MALTPLGDLNIVTAQRRYQIAGNDVLWHNGNVNDIFVGVGAGNGTMTGHFNTFVGRNAGTVNQSGANNTFIGNSAGANNSTGRQNTFIGKSAGLTNTTGFSSTVVGFEALRDNTTGAGNTAVGWEALWRNTTGFNNTAIGIEAMLLTTTAFQNVAVGAEALRNNKSGIQNVAVGFEALRRNLSDENTAVGCSTLVNNINGHRNTAIGDDVLTDNDANSNTGVGSEALTSNLTGNNNTAIGDNALRWTQNGDANTASGYQAGKGVKNKSHTRNCFYGYSSGLSIVNGSNNAFMGYQSGQNITNGTGNIFFGYNSAQINTDGSRNIIIGQQANLSSNNFTNAIAIGSEAIITAKNKMILGNDSINVGIGLSNDVTTTNFYGANNKLEIDAGINGHNPSASGAGKSGLRFRDLHAGGPSNYQGVAITENISQTNQFTTPAVLSVDVNGDVILVPDATGIANADNGCSLDGPTNFVHLGNNVGNSQAALQNDREVPLANHNLIFTGTPDVYPGKMGFGIAAGNSGPQALRTTPITMQVNGSISLFDGTGNTSLFFGEEQFAAGSGTLGEWGIQFDPAGGTNGGLNFWKPVGSNGYNFGNRFLFLCNNGNVGIGATATSAPANALEITSYTFNPQPAGLRFTNLTSSAAPVTNPGTGVLAVDGNGDVIYVDANSGGGGGFGYCPTPTTLTGNAGINLGSHNFYFEDGAPFGQNMNDVSIGSLCGQGVKGKLSVNNDNEPIAGRFYSSQSTPTSPLTGVVSIVELTGSGQAVGGQFNASGSSSQNIGIYASQIQGSSAATATGGDWAGYFEGDINVTGTGSFVGGTITVSDSVFKTNINTISNPISIISLLKPKSFYYDTANSYRFHFLTKKQYGFIAQNIKQVLPELIYDKTLPADSVHPSLTYSSLNYNAFFGLLTAAMQQQQLSIDSLRNAPPGSVAAGNGLSTNSGVVELGGTLSHPTQIASGLNNFEINNGSYANISLGSNPAVYPTTSGGGASGVNIAIGHQNNFTDQHGISLGDLNSVGYYGTAIGNTNDLSTSSVSFALGSGVKVQNTGGSTITSATGIGEGLHNYASHSIVMGQQLALPPGGSGVFIGSHFATSAVTSMENYVANNPGASYAQIDVDAENSQQGLSPDVIPGLSVTNANRVGVGKLAPQSKLDVYGSINSNGFPVTSDSTLKTNIAALPNGALAKVNALRPVTYNWINKVDTFMYGTQYGFTAQQVETVVPDLVKTTGDNHKHLNYNGLISLLTKALQEQQAQIDSMKTALNSCCNNGNHYGNSRSTSSIDVELSDADAVVLNQNVPNPFAEQTTISYNIPKNTSAAMILFYDINGRQIKSVEIAKKGKGQLNVFANDLSNGVYSYTLVVDGKIFETKKMIKQ